MMKDMHQLATSQGITLDEAHDHVRAADAEVGEGTRQTREAEHLKQKWRCKVVVLVLIIAAILAILITILVLTLRPKKT
jgi:t-SNARE complex subunit (syntaxin)